MFSTRGAVAAALVALCVAVPDALAHEGNPNYRSEVRSIAPAVPGLHARVLNFDDRIELVYDGHDQLIVDGYRDEPYLRFQPDGRVEVNRRSPAGYLNEDRYAQVDLPAAADPKARPQWRTIARNGRYDWHDHRIHWMGGAGSLPPAVKDESEPTRVFDWTIPVEAGGTARRRPRAAELARQAGRRVPARRRSVARRRAGGRGPAGRVRAPPPLHADPRGVVRLAALTLALLALLPATAEAHAVLEGSQPERGEHVRRAPAEVTLRFDEPVEVAFGAVRVFDAAGRRVDAGSTQHPGGHGDQVAVGLRRGLGDGIYTATYRVISADSHPVSGGFVFSVGAGGAQPRLGVDQLIETAGAGPVTETAFGLARGLSYLAIALCAGGLAFALAVWRPAAPHPAFDARARRVQLAAAATGAGAAALGIVLQGATAAGTTFWSALDPAVVGDVLGTRFGTVWGLRLLAFAAFATPDRPAALARHAVGRGRGRRPALPDPGARRSPLHARPGAD